MGFCMDPLTVLSQAKSAVIKQQIELLEIFTGCETNNRYHVYITTNSGEFVYLFKCKEESSWCDKNCCSSESRPFSMKMRHVNNQADYFAEDYSNYFAIAERPFKCTCCYFERPELTTRNNNAYFGKVTEPFSCCDPIFHVKDANNEVKWKITAECCQCGLLCRTRCGVCSEALFPIHSGNKTELDPKNCEGHIKKLSAGIQELVSDADNFELVFPVNATPEEKLTLISAVLLIDYRFFEDNGKNNRNNRY